MRKALFAAAPFVLLACSALLGDNVCGDGVIDQFNGEECDGGPGCDPENCILVAPVCGDGITDLAAGEECDDGNTLPGDGCDALCLIEVACEAGDDCEDGNECTINDRCDVPSGICVRDSAERGTSCEVGAGINICNGAGQCVPSVCGDGFLDPAVDEGCDDANTVSGDGCDATCQVEAGIIVADCGNNSSALQDALAAAQDGDEIQVAGDGCALGGVVLNGLNVRIFGAGADQPTVEVSDSIDINGNSRVVFEFLDLSADANDHILFVDDTAEVAVIASTLENATGANDGGMLRCLASAKVLLHRSELTGSTTGDAVIASDGTCQVIVSNSLVHDNADKDALRVQGDSRAALLFSTFFNNTAEQGIAECAPNARLVLDSTLAEQVGNPNEPIKDCVAPVFLNSFVENEDLGNGTLANAPALQSDLHIGNPLALGTGSANPSIPNGFFDPLVTFGINIFAVDFEGTPRPANPDPGAFED